MNQPDASTDNPASPIPHQDVAAALGVHRGELVAIVGGGGKTTTMFAIADGAPVRSAIVTTTTKMGTDQTEGRPSLVNPSDAELVAALRDHRSIVVWGSTEGEKAIGIAPETCARWLPLTDLVVVEADGARRKSFKAPKAYEPVIPVGTSRLVACIGSDALGAVISERCHRPERVAALALCSPDDRLTPKRAARVLLANDGSRKGCPTDAVFNVVINRIDDRSSVLAHELYEVLQDHDEAERCDGVVMIRHHDLEP